MSEEDFKKLVAFPNRIIISCDDQDGSILASGDLNKLGVVVSQVLTTNDQMYKFLFKAVNNAMSERAKLKKTKS